MYSELLLAHDAEFDEDEFLALVLHARTEVLDSFQEDSLMEAVAGKLASEHGFLVIDDSQLRVSVNLSADDGQTRVSSVEERAAAGDVEEEGFRSLLLDVDTEDRRWGDA